MTNIDPTRMQAAAEKMFQILDAKDGNADGKIEKSIWNQFAQNSDVEGNEIKNYIVKENAIKAIVRYMQAQCEKFATVGFEAYVKPVFENAINKIKGAPLKDPNPPQADANPPQAGTNPPKADSNPPQATTLPEYWVPKKELAGQTILNKDGTSIKYDEDGYANSVYDENGNKIRQFGGPGGICYDYEYDENGNQTREILRERDGSVIEYYDYEYGENGRDTIARKPDGSVRSYSDNEYDENGNITRGIVRKPDGSVMSYCDYEYDENGNQTRMIRRKPDGSARFYYNYEYDENGNQTREIGRKPDGTVSYYTDRDVPEKEVDKTRIDDKKQKEPEEIPPKGYDE